MSRKANIVCIVICLVVILDSFKFHMAMGFDEANRIICFKKRL